MDKHQVLLTFVPENIENHVVGKLRNIQCLSLSEAFDIIKSLPQVIWTGTDKSFAKRVVFSFKKFGCDVEIRDVNC